MFVAVSEVVGPERNYNRVFYFFFPRRMKRKIMFSAFFIVIRSKRLHSTIIRQRTNRPNDVHLSRSICDSATVLSSSSSSSLSSLTTALCRAAVQETYA